MAVSLFALLVGPRVDMVVDSHLGRTVLDDAYSYQ